MIDESLSPEDVHTDWRLSTRRSSEPFHWWGPVWTPPAPRGMPELIQGGVLSAELGGWLWVLMAQRVSVVVVAGPGGAGKTTLLTALLDLLPPDTRRVYIRGCYEPFDFLTAPDADPGQSILLVNEISPHLPIYLWGPGVRRFLRAARDGYALAATAHATGVEAFVASLSGYPLRVPATEIAAFDLVVLLDAWVEEGAIRREVREVATLSPAPGPLGGVTIDRLAERLRRGMELEVNSDVAIAQVERVGGLATAPADEARERALWLHGLANARPKSE